jgi:hypothetical protein
VVREEDWAKENWEPRAAPLVASRFGRYKATFSYVAEHPDELDFNEGELMTLVKKAEDEGWIVARLDRGPEGLVPLTHLTGAGEEDPNAVIKPAAKPALKHAQTLPTAMMEPSRTTQGPTLQHAMSVQLSQAPLQPAEAEAEAPPGSARQYPLVAAESLSSRTQQVVQPAPAGVSTASAAAPSTSSAIGARAPDPEQPTAVALFAYVAANADEMSFQAGDKLDILGPAVDSGWLRARHVRTRVEAIVPMTHLEVPIRPCRRAQASNGCRACKHEP